MIALLSTLILTVSAQAAPAFTIDQAIEKFTADMQSQCDFEAEDVTRRRENTTVTNIASTGEIKATYQLFDIPCFNGAYNFSSVFYVADEYAGLQLVHFAEPVLSEKGFSVIGWSTQTMLVNAGFEPKNNTLGFFSKGRGLGDCYTSGMYKFVNGRFLLKNYEVDNECDGKFKGRKIVNLK